ncbi:hypothetical protein ACFSCV_06740 [Methylopila henanensis]|uniref:Uncharacterized protein n=1 Tax=Methylopila henanensis TaxID=873516 RepID=A0ABW4K4M6_9HYPH
MRGRAAFLVLAAALMGASMPAPARAFDFDDWEKSEDAQGVLTFDCARFDACGSGSRITVASASDGPPIAAADYRAQHERNALERPELRGKVTLGPAATRTVRGFDVVEVEREVRLAGGLTHHAINAILHRGGKRYQIICSAKDKAMARANFEGVLLETIAFVSR